MSDNEFPAGWDEERVRRVLLHYEAQTEEEATREDEAAFQGSKSRVLIEVPAELVPLIRQLISQYQARAKA
jgi:hypothetical protein